jgi:hypothetical protein
MLGGLLLLCLMAPRYWRSSSLPQADHRTGTRQPPAGGTVYLPFLREENRAWSPSGGRSYPELDPLRLWPAPTIEELVAARTGYPRLEDQPFRFPTIVPLSVSPDANSSQPVAARSKVPGPIATAALMRVGRMLLEYSPNNAMARFSTNFAGWVREWSLQLAQENRLQPAVSGQAHGESTADSSTLRLLSPGDRFAQRGTNIHAPQTAPDFDGTSLPSGSAGWCAPQELLDQLQRLARHPDSAVWAEQTIGQLIALTARDQLAGEDVQTLLAALGDAAQYAVQMAEATGDDRLRVELLRAHWGLARRLDCWAAIHEIRVAQQSRDRVALHGPIESFFGRSQPHSMEIVQPPPLSVDLEAYEQTRDPQLGRRVVHQQRALETSADALDRSLAESVERHYRNANVRIALTAEFLNRFVAQERSEIQPLRDRIAGTPVRGRSYTQSESRLRLDPAAGRWQMTVEADGLVDSQTLVDGGSARLRSHSATNFAARKSVLVDANGVRLRRTMVDANNHNRLVGVTTDFDWVPLLGSFARDRAVSQYRAKRERAKAEIEFRVSNEAVGQVDRDTLGAVERIENQIRQRLTDRLAKSGVDLTPIELTTMRERVVGRFRVAGEHQLGSHTPRPRALSDSLASVQVHETALTNAAVTLALDARRYTGPELQQAIRDALPGMTTGPLEHRHDAVFHFAREDAIQFHITDGRLELALALAGVEQGGRTMRNVIVHAYYVPEVNGLTAELVRDGSLGIEGRLSSSERARLHNVFDSVLPPDRRLPILRLADPNDSRLEGLMITQLVLEDGWLGLAIGPIAHDRTAERSRSLR